MKRMLLILAAAVLLLTTVAPTVVRADNLPIGTNCGGGGYCKP